METTIHDNEIMILVKITKYFKDYERYDIVVLKDEKENIIKRIYGLPGETIKCVEGKIYINDEEIKDEYGQGTTFDFEEVVLDDDSYFVLGDNREVSKDSRIIGPVLKNKIKGRANLVIYPFKNIRNVD